MGLQQQTGPVMGNRGLYYGRYLIPGAGLLLLLAVVAGMLPFDSPAPDRVSAQPSGAPPFWRASQRSSITRERVIDEVLESSYLSENSQQPELKIVSRILVRGDTLLAVLTEAGVSLGEAYSAIEAIKSVFDPRGLRPGQQLRLNLRQQDKATKSVHLERLALVSAVDQSISLRHLENERFDALILPLDHERQIVSRTGRISTSFYDATVNQGVPMAVLLQVDDTLRSVIDFRRDIRRGDSFALEFELFNDGENGGIHPGKLVSVSLGLNNRTLVISRFTTADGYTGFFDLAGRSIKTSLMTTPLEDSRLSSLFGNRNHPILGYKRFHKGIDFAAPRGTPVFAAGDGVVLQRRRFGGLGKFIKIQHDKVYTTTYAHLSNYASDLEPGRRVLQGEIIGYVGDTGLASGPNLHYEVRANGRETNPLTLELPPRRILSGEELARFRQQAASLAVVSGFSDPADARGHTANVAARGDGNE